MARKPRPSPPDGQPKSGPQKSRVSLVDDPLISGDSAPPSREEADETTVDEGGQARTSPPPVDLLH